MHPGGLGTAEEIETDGMLIAEATIELEPKHIGCDLRCVLDHHSPDQTEDVRHTRALGGGGQILVSTRPYDRGASHWGDADGCRVAPAEQFDIHRRQGGGDAIARHELDSIERVPVSRDTAIAARATIHVFEGEARHMRPSMLAQICSRRKAAMQLGKTRIIGRRVITRGRSKQGGGVVHGRSPFRLSL